MNLYWDKMIGFPLFVLLGGFAINWSVNHVPIVFVILMVVYPVIAIQMPRDLLMDCPHFFYRGLVTGTALAVVCWMQRWPFLIMFIAAIFLTDPNYNEEKDRLRRFRTRIRKLSGGATHED